jgi:hypothetical protein
MLKACNVEDFTAKPVSLANPLSSVLKVRANRLPRRCLGASQSTKDARSWSNDAPLARPHPLTRVPGAHPIPLSPKGDSLLGVSL